MKYQCFALNMGVQVVVLAGGFGTRLRPWTKHCAKPLLPLVGRTLLERVVEALDDELVDEVLVAAGYGIEQMREHFSNVENILVVLLVRICFIGTSLDIKGKN